MPESSERLRDDGAGEGKGCERSGQVRAQAVTEGDRHHCRSGARTLTFRARCKHYGTPMQYLASSEPSGVLL